MSAPPNGRLDGWKAIAGYLARDQRTVQRWRRERGMPVHQVPGGRRGAVFAYGAELDAWLARASAPVTGPGENDVPGPVNRERLFEAPETRPTRRRWTASLAVGLALGAGAVAFVASAPWPGAAAPTERIALRSGHLTGLDGDAQELWSFRLPYLAESTSGGARLAARLDETASVDFDADGAEDWLAFVHYELGSSEQFQRDDAYAVSSAGRLLWTFTPAYSWTFAGRTFSGPWAYRAYFPARSSSGTWVSFIHHTWWPSFLVRLDAGGRGHPTFVNAGHIESVRAITLDNRGFVLAAGVNNEYRSAILAVLDEAMLPATSPQGAGSAYACSTCPSGRPRRYVLFPRSEVNVALKHPYNFGDLISAPDADGSIEVSVRETPVPGGHRSLYRFSSNLWPQAVGMSDRYWEMHDELFRAGTLDHPVDRCPERVTGMVVRVWEPTSGWQDVLVPPTFPPASGPRAAP